MNGVTVTYSRPNGEEVTVEGGEFDWDVNGIALVTDDAVVHIPNHRIVLVEEARNG